MKILWGRILIAAVVLELLYGLFLIFILGSADYAYTPLGMATVFVFMMIGGAWIGLKAASRRVFHGGLVGLVAVLFYTVLTSPAVFSGELVVTGPFLLNHVAKILGGISGGLLSATVLNAKTRRRADVA
jgi:hypothetical protein